jgi:hypothetical protein
MTACTPYGSIGTVGVHLPVSPLPRASGHAGLGVCTRAARRAAARAGQKEAAHGALRIEARARGTG